MSLSEDIDRDRVDLSKYKTNASLTRHSAQPGRSAGSSLSSQAPTISRKSSTSGRPPPPASSAGLGRASAGKLGRMSMGALQQQPGGGDGGGGIGQQGGSFESRIREVQRQSFQAANMEALDRVSRGSSVTSQNSQGNPEDIENLSVEVQVLEITDDTTSPLTTSPVTFKFDGQRFHMKETVKLYERREYCFKIKLAPNLSLAQPVLSIGAQITEKSGSKTRLNDGIFLDQDRKDEHVGQWTCSLNRSGKGDRQPLSLSLDVKGFSRVSFDILVKVYGEKEAAGRHGQVLKMAMFTVKKAPHPKGTATVLRSQYIEGFPEGM